MLRPNFVRSQVGDVDMFERHVQNVIQAIPKDGSMVDLHDVFFKMSLDVATEFLFGESTGMLKAGDGNQEAKRFVEAFTYSQNALEGDDGILTLLLPGPRKKLRAQHKIVHGKRTLR